MGLFTTDPKEAGANWGRHLNPFSSLMKSLGGGPGEQMPSQQAQISPELSQLAASQKSQADSFQAGKGQMGRDMGQLQGETGRAQLAQQMAGIGKSFNSRGLLHSGLKVGAQSGAKGAMASNLAGQQVGTNIGLNQQGEQMDLGAAKTGMNIRDQKQQIENQRYADAMARYQARRDEDSGFGMFTSGAKGLFGGAAY